MIPIVNTWPFWRGSREEIFKSPENLRPLKFLAYHIKACAYDRLGDKDLDREKAHQIRQAIGRLEVPSSDLDVLSHEDSFAHTYGRIRNLGELMEPAALNQATRFSVLRASPMDINGEEGMKMRHALIFVYHYLPEQLSMDDAVSLIKQIINANTENYQDVVNSCFEMLKIRKPDIYPDSDYFEVYRITAEMPEDPLDFETPNSIGIFHFSLLNAQKKGAQILLDMLPDGRNWNRFNRSFAEFVKSGEYFKQYTREPLKIGSSQVIYEEAWAGPRLYA